MRSPQLIEAVVPFYFSLALCLSLPCNGAEIEGKVTIKGLPKKCWFDAGYHGIDKKGAYLFNGAGGQFDDNRFETSGLNFKPRISTTGLNWKKKEGGYFHHFGVPPGKYLIYAQIEKRFTAWQVVDVNGPEEKVSLDFTLDLGEAGELEILVPAANKKALVRLAPANVQGKQVFSLGPRVTPDFLPIIFADAPDKKVLLNYLRPGKYLVTCELGSGQSLFDCGVTEVEIKKGQRTKVQLTKAEAK